MSDDAATLFYTHRERQLAVALRDAVVHRYCFALGPQDMCRSNGLKAMERCNRARRLIGVPAGMLARLEDER